LYRYNPINCTRTILVYYPCTSSYDC